MPRESPVTGKHSRGLGLFSLDIFYRMKLPYYFIASVCISLAYFDNADDSGTGKRVVQVNPNKDSRV